MPHTTDVRAQPENPRPDAPPEAETETGRVLPLEELDRLLSPLRRTLAYALADGRENVDAVRYLEVNAKRWVQNALTLDLPHALRDLLASINGRLAGYDAAPEEGRRERLQAMNQTLTRLDAVLGLPLGSLHRPGQVGTPTRTEQTSKKASRAGSRARGKPERKRGRASAPSKAVKEGQRTAPTKGSAKAGPAALLRLGDVGFGGRNLADLGVAPEVLEPLAAHGVKTLADLLLLPPVGEEVVRPVHGAGREIPEGRAAVGGRVRSRWTLLKPDGTRTTRLLLHGAGPLEARWPGGASRAVLENLAPGTKTILVGAFRNTEAGGCLEDAETAVDWGTHAVHLAQYGVPGVSDRVLRQEMLGLLDGLQGIRDSLSPKTANEAGVAPLELALRCAHTAVSAKPEGRRRLAFDEALAVTLGLARSRAEGSRERGLSHAILHGLTSQTEQFHSLALADSQQAALEQVKRDLKSNRPMLRLLTGELGVGEGRVTTLAVIMVAESKSQVMCVSPDPVTAETRFLFMEPLLREMGLVARLIDDQPNRAQQDAVRRGEVHVVFGTSRLLEVGLQFRRLGLVIAAEPGATRATANHVARMRAPHPDTLVFTTTPTPTEALIRAYADHDLSVLEGMLARVPRSELVPGTERRATYDRVATRVAAGEQAWVLFPLVRGRDALDAREATRVKATLESQVFQGARVGLFHGAMGREERHRTYVDFQHRRYDVLVSTSLVEEGPPVPEATIAVIEQADRLSWDRITSIRAHVARARREASCSFILGDDPDPAGTARLEHLLAHHPFDADPEEGVGALSFPEDAPHPAFRWLRPKRDRRLVIAAHHLALNILSTDSSMRSAANSEVARACRFLWPRIMDTPCPIPEPPSGSSSRRRRRRRKRK
jgi:ATP-dependent DNA helicase RecG